MDASLLLDSSYYIPNILFGRTTKNEIENSATHKERERENEVRKCTDIQKPTQL